MATTVIKLHFDVLVTNTELKSGGCAALAGKHEIGVEPRASSYLGGGKWYCRRELGRQATRSPDS